MISIYGVQLYQLFLPGSGERAGATQVSWSALCGVYEAYEEVCAVCVLEGLCYSIGANFSPSSRATARDRLLAPTSGPFDPPPFQQLSGVGMVLAGVHLTARVHAALHQPQHPAQWTFTSQGFHQGPGTITHHLGQLDQAALGVLPGKEHDEPVLGHHADHLGVQLTQRPEGDWPCATRPPAHAVSTACKAVPFASVRASLTRAA